MCSHQFFMVLDKQGDIRGYGRIDIDLGEPTDDQSF